jgi:hypothetical protein
MASSKFCRRKARKRLRRIFYPKTTRVIQKALDREPLTARYIS